MITALDIQNGIESLRPSSTEFTFSARAKFCDEVMRKVYKQVGLYKVVDYRLTTSVKSFDLSTCSTQCRIENLANVWVTATKTTISSNCTSTTLWNSYEVPELVDYKNDNTVNFSKYFPDERIVRLRFLAIPALFPTTSTDSTSIPDIDREATDIIKYGVLARICKAGDAPDVDLANAYEQDYREEVRRVKVLVRNRSRKMKNDPVSYKEWEW